MKKIEFFVAVFMLNITVALAQNETVNGVLTVNTSGTANTIRVENDAAGESAAIRFRSKPSNGSGWLHSDISVHATNNNVGFLGFKVPHNNNYGVGYKMVINSDGNLGIGTISPFSGTGNQGVHMSKGTHSSLLIGDPKAGYGGVVQASDGKQRVFIGANLYDDQTGSWSSFVSGKGSAGISIVADEGGWGTSIGLITSTSDGHYNQSMAIIGNGNVGIGTNTPQSKLAVEGQIRATEVKVLADISVPDYVFEQDYELRTLKETKEYISENKHLPEIPSAAEIGENGIDLGDMNMRLLRKIEELTLYQIELLERLEKAEQEISQLKNK